MSLDVKGGNFGNIVADDGFIWIDLLVGVLRFQVDLDDLAVSEGGLWCDDSRRVICKNFLSSFGAHPGTWAHTVGFDDRSELRHGLIELLLICLGLDIAAPYLDPHLGQHLLERLDLLSLGRFLLQALLLDDLDLLLGDLLLFIHVLIFLDIHEVRVIIIVLRDLWLTSLNWNAGPVARGCPGMTGIHRKAVKEAVAVVVPDRFFSWPGEFRIFRTWKITFAEEGVLSVNG